jgi:hypothetical protein
MGMQAARAWQVAVELLCSPRTLLMGKVVFFGALFAKHRQDLGLAVHHGAWEWEEQQRMEPNIHTSISRASPATPCSCLALALLCEQALHNPGDRLR